MLLAASVAIPVGAQGSPEQLAISDHIESIIVLPDGATPLSEYSRNYVNLSDGAVMAVYWRPHPPIKEGWKCGRLLPLERGDPLVIEWETCSDAHIEAENRRIAEIMSQFAPVGSSRWLARLEDLPMQFGGHCNYITIIYKPALGEFESIECNFYR
jgi:hypothetical protein